MTGRGTRHFVEVVESSSDLSIMMVGRPIWGVCRAPELVTQSADCWSTAFWFEGEGRYSVTFLFPNVPVENLQAGSIITFNHGSFLTVKLKFLCESIT